MSSNVFFEAARGVDGAELAVRIDQDGRTRAAGRDAADPSREEGRLSAAGPDADDAAVGLPCPAFPMSMLLLPVVMLIPGR